MQLDEEWLSDYLVRLKSAAMQGLRKSIEDNDHARIICWKEELDKIETWIQLNNRR